MLAKIWKNLFTPQSSIFMYLYDKELIALLHSWLLLSMLSEKAHKYWPIIRRFMTFYVHPKRSTWYHPHFIFRANIDLWVCKLWIFLRQGYQVSSFYLARIIALLNISKNIGIFYHPNNDWHVFNLQLIMFYFYDVFIFQKL